MDLHDLNEFLKLSAALNYQLSARTVGREKLLLTIIGNKPLPERDRQVLLEVLEYLDLAYRTKRRRLGTMAVLHPLRAAALLSAAEDELRLLDLLSVLLHDKYEDVSQTDFSAKDWKELEERFYNLLKRIDPTDEWYLMERLTVLTRRGDHETYYEYIGRLLERSDQTPELVRVKLADRLDNTLDLRIDYRDPLENVDFFGYLFGTLFIPDFRSYRPDLPHTPELLDGGRRMYGLFKTAVTLSLMRQTGALADDDRAAHALFEALCVASMKEAERILMHIFGYHRTDVRQQRALLIDTMEYCRNGGVVSITDPSAPHRLDGLFLEQFDFADRKRRHEKLDELYRDTDLMIQAAVAFIVIFMSFLDDPDYYVQGVSADGIKALPSDPV
ncbi:MAG: hypothetical protein DRI90_05930 [Deltaproteobacteria bacterium]|nr:MAG: hypothetical protein DRI90_05930 [Deltaproteobacteria bacterium]